MNPEAAAGPGSLGQRFAPPSGVGWGGLQVAFETCLLEFCNGSTCLSGISPDPGHESRLETCYFHLILLWCHQPGTSHGWVAAAPSPHILCLGSK